jgi:cytochrome b561
LLGFIVLHLAGVLKHQFIDRSNILRRMLPGGNS